MACVLSGLKFGELWTSRTQLLRLCVSAVLILLTACESVPDTPEMAVERQVNLHRVAVAAVESAAADALLPTRELERELELLESEVLATEISEFSDQENRSKLLILISTETVSKDLITLLVTLAHSQDKLAQYLGIHGLGEVGCVDKEASLEAIQVWLAQPNLFDEERRLGRESLETLRKSCEEDESLP